jgi:vacuolar protein sorting-associated protein 13A/C
MSTQIKFRQVGFDDDAWRWIKPHSTVAFAWDNPQGDQLLEVIPDGDTSSSSSSSSYTGLIRIDVNKVGDHPVLSTTNGPDTRNICIRVLEAVDIKVVRFFDQEMTIRQSRNSSAEDEGEIEMSVPMEGASQPMQANNLDKRPDAPSQFKFVLDVGKLGLSIVNHRPQELLFLHMERVKVEISYSSGSSSENTNRYFFHLAFYSIGGYDTSWTWIYFWFATERTGVNGSCIIISNMFLMSDVVFSV